MACSGVAERGEAVCVCSGTTVFEGAAIGQLFTGDVRMQCPYAVQQATARQESVRETRETGCPLSTALIALAIWQAVYAPDGMDGALGSSVAHALMFLVAGVLTRYFRSHALRLLARVTHNRHSRGAK
jgi:hypothetical protein